MTIIFADGSPVDFGGLKIVTPVICLDFTVCVRKRDRQAVFLGCFAIRQKLLTIKMLNIEDFII